MIIQEAEEVLLILQFNAEATSKTFSYFESELKAIEYILDLYEEYLVESNSNNSNKSIKQTNSSLIKIVEMNELITFVYSFHDFAYLKYDKEKGVYQPFGKDWFTEILKKYIEAHLNGK